MQKLNDENVPARSDDGKDVATQTWRCVMSTRPTDSTPAMPASARACSRCPHDDCRAANGFDECTLEVDFGSTTMEKSWEGWCPVHGWWRAEVFSDGLVYEQIATSGDIMSADQLKVFDVSEGKPAGAIGMTRKQCESMYVQLRAALGYDTELSDALKSLEFWKNEDIFHKANNWPKNGPILSFTKARPQPTAAPVFIM